MPAAEAAVACTNSSDDWASYQIFRDVYGRSVPLRCGYWDGVKGWGVVKLKAKGRWNAWYQGMIGATLEHPVDHWAQNATTDIYVTGYQWACTPVYRFRVVVNTTTKDGKRYMMGVVNAYKESL